MCQAMIPQKSMKSIMLQEFYHKLRVILVKFVNYCVYNVQSTSEYVSDTHPLSGEVALVKTSKYIRPLLS